MANNPSCMQDLVMRNPPYQEETESDSTRKPPVYNLFMEEAYKVADTVELITPARFLFNAGYTPKSWNEKMLNDPHLKIVQYESDGSVVFPGQDIKGGVAVSIRDVNKDYGAIEVFTKFPELNQILKKVTSQTDQFLDQIISSPLSYGLSQKMKSEHPELTDRLRSSAFSNLKSILTEEKPNDNHEYIQLVGLENGKRGRRFIRRDYIKDSAGILEKFSLLIPKAIGSGVFGEQLSSTEFAEPGVGYTQTFIGIGAFDSEKPLANIDKYLKTKFARAMLGVLKITQDCPGPKWKYVPCFNFDETDQIDWTQSIQNVDEQLFKYFNLSSAEIEFIKKQVKEME